MLTAADFIRSPTPGNRGSLSLALFPGYTDANLIDFLNALITVGYAEPKVIAAAGDTEKDRLVTAYVYASAYDEALMLAALRPTEIALDDLGTRKVDIKTLTGILSTRRKEALAQWEAETIVPGPPVDRNPSVTVPLVPGW